MANDAPILILQMQRMGDLVLTFPLILWLKRRFPGRPIWVVGEASFFQGLLPISPSVVYFPWTSAPNLRKESYLLIINLSHRPEAARLAGELSADEKLGPVATESASYIRGDWHLYRASLVHNNRHNLFHWADLNALDLIPTQAIATTKWATPRVGPSVAVKSGEEAETNRVGLFLGASEPPKRPGAKFWAQLAREMLDRDLRPVLLGGPAEAELGQRVAQLIGASVLNLCGRFSLEEFVRMSGSLALMVTPDTGPMHVSAWSGLTCLNLSMGPVNPWETAPYPPGHYVLRSTISCRGCWRAVHRPPRCKRRFEPRGVAMLARRIMDNNTAHLGRIHLPGLALTRTDRDEQGLFALRVVARMAGAESASSGRGAVSRLWRAFFGAHHGLWDDTDLRQRIILLENNHPGLHTALFTALAGLGRDLSRAAKRPGPDALPSDFWAKHPPLMRPLTGYLHLLLQNTDFSRQGLLHAASLIEEFLAR